MKITIARLEEMNDWYKIIRADHTNLNWFEPYRNGMRFMKSERLSPEACIEGTKEEMLAIAHAIDNKTIASFKRMAVEYNRLGFYFWSPKNSDGQVFITIADAEDLANQIYTLCGSETRREMSVQDLINELTKIEDKSRIVYIESEGPLYRTYLEDDTNTLLLFGNDED